MIAVFIDRLAFDKLHDEVRQSVISRAAIKQSRNIRVMERGENLPFVSESPHNEFSIHPALDHLERDLFAVLVGAFGQVNRAHPAAPDFAHNLVMTEAAACHRRLICQQVAEFVERRSFDKIGRLIERGNQRFNLTAQTVITGTGLRQE